MNRLRCLKTIVLLVAAVTVFGCKSKQESAGNSAPQTQTQPQPAEAVKSISGQSAAGVVASSPQDKKDTEAAATRVITLMEAGDFPTIYKEASPAFQKIGKVEDFNARFAATRQKVGALGAAKEASFVTRPDQAYVVVYHQENPKFKTERRLTFVRSKEGKMELFGLNQHDEPKGAPAK